jgi:uncharacterized protein (DUF1778 family)
VRTRPQVVSARVTLDEKKLIITAAEEAGLPVSEYALRLILARAESVLAASGGSSVGPSQLSSRSEP